MKIYYLDFYYDDTVPGLRRTYPLAGVNKASYVIQILSSIGETVVVSPCSVADGSFEKSGLFSLNRHAKLKLFTSLKANYAAGRWIRRIWIRIQCFFYLLTHIKKGDMLVVYHSLFYMNAVRLVKAFTKVKTILQIEEIYAHVSEDSSLERKELSYFKCVDGYLFPTELLEKKVNTAGKPFAIAYGNYKVLDVTTKPARDGRIHCVYAGTLDPRKGGAGFAVQAAIFLPESYYVHILGFGTQKEVNDITAEIQEVSQKTKATVSYDGVLTGDAFSAFLQQCHVGLSTQMIHASFADSSFPSKILTYLGNGLQVVCPCIPVIQQSKIANVVTFYDKQTPQSIAEAIMSVDIDTESHKTVLQSLDELFENEVRKMVSEFNHP